MVDQRRRTCERTMAWCFNAGGYWRKRIDPIVGAVIDLDCP
jgi:hypothetical protein